jgi:hypothetical protein
MRHDVKRARRIVSGRVRRRAARICQTERLEARKALDLGIAARWPGQPGGSQSPAPRGRNLSALAAFRPIGFVTYRDRDVMVLSRGQSFLRGCARKHRRDSL